MNKRIRCIISAMLTVLTLSFFVGCGDSSSSTGSVSMSKEVSDVDVEKMLSSIKVEDDTSNYDKMATITLNGDSISVDGEGAKVDGNKVTISSGGLYTISGELNDGQIIVNAGDDDKVKLELDGVNLKCSNNSAICVTNADKTVINLKEGTKNTIEDGTEYDISENDEQNAAIFSKDDLIIDGSGSLEVKGNYKNGIVSKDDLTIVNSTLNVTSKNDGIKGKDSLGVKDVNITVNSEGDGMQASNDTNTEKGYVLIESGTINITSTAGDGIQAETVLAIRDGDINITSGGGSANATKKAGNDDFGGKMNGNRGQQMPQDGQTSQDGQIPQDGGQMPQDGQTPPDGGQMPQDGQTPPDGGQMPQDGQTPPDGNMQNKKTQQDNTETTDESSSDTVSTKGLKSTNNITIEKGNITIDSADDTLHTNSSINIKDGNLKLNAGDDGIHADSAINISGGNINIEKSNEGIEATTINISGGETKLVASDDGINGTGTASNDSSSNDNGGFGGKGGMNAATDAMVTISGGYLYIDASGDGFDSNGNAEMTGGTVIINGPTNDGNGAIDYNGSFEVKGGTLIAAGSLGMAQAPSESSTQYSVSIGLSETQKANSLIHIEDADGNEVITFAPTKTYNSVVICSDKLQKDKEYKVVLGGSSTATQKDGLYSEGEYSKGTEFKTFKVSGSVTSVGETSSMGGNRGGMGGKGNRKQFNNSTDSTENKNNENSNGLQTQDM